MRKKSKQESAIDEKFSFCFQKENRSAQSSGAPGYAGLVLKIDNTRILSFYKRHPSHGKRKAGHSQELDGKLCQ